MEIPDKIRSAAQRLKDGYRINRITVRDFLKHFGAERRGYKKVREIREILDTLDLVTEPDFEIAWIDEPIWLKLKHAVARKASAEPAVAGVPPELELENAGVEHALAQSETALLSAEPDNSPRGDGTESYFADDPTFRIGSLPAARKRLIAIGKDDSLIMAVTLMLRHDFSQLPVMQGGREVRGVISWKSIGSKLALGTARGSVKDFSEDVHIIDGNRTLFEAIPTIVEAGYVLVRDQQDRRIIGIMTASDLSLQFQELSEPFLLLKEIELHIRTFLREKLVTADFDILKSQPPSNRQIEDVDELTMSQYIALFCNEDIWNKLDLKIDRREFASLLEKVRAIRNEVMHFDRDPMTRDELNVLKQGARFMQSLHELIKN